MKIRFRKRKVNGRLYRDWVVDMGKVEQPDGTLRRQVRAFPSEAAAESFRAAKMGLRRRHGDAAITLPADVALRYAAVEDRLAGAGASIEQAADYYLAHHQPVREVVTLGELLDRCVLDMELRKVRGNTIATFKCACKSFLGTRHTRSPASVTREEVRAWIYGHGWVPKTQRGYLGAVTQLFAWAVEEGLLAESPLKPDVRTGKRKAAVKLPKLVRKEPRIFTPEQIGQLFRTAMTKEEIGLDRRAEKGEQRRPQRVYRRLLGFLALATFGGIRPFELTRLETSAIDLDAGLVPLDSDVTKMSDRRVVELSANCVEWLRIWREEFPGYRHVAPPSWDRLMKHLRTAAGLRPWPHDVLRHCFASYFHAEHGNKTALQNQMGHSESEDTLDLFYRAVRMPDGKPVTKAQAKLFWGIRPGVTLRLSSGASSPPPDLPPAKV